jgi:hypothetical protein
MTSNNKGRAIIYSFAAFLSLYTPRASSSDGGVVQAGSHNASSSLRIKEIDTRVSEINRELRRKTPTEAEKSRLKNEKKKLLAERERIRLADMGIPPKIPGPVTYER